MEPLKNNSIDDNLEELSKEELDKIKQVTDIRNAQDYGLSTFEKFIKRRIVPIFIPLLTLSATFIFFALNYYDGEKKKAVERYNSELELVKMVWKDVNEDTIPHSKKYYKSINFLKEMFKANKSNFKDDQDYIGIDSLHRPIALLQLINSDLSNSIQTTVKNNDANNLIAKNLVDKDKTANQTVDPVKLNQNYDPQSYKPIIQQKVEVNNIINSINGNSKNYKIYIQFSSKENIDKVEYMANQLKDYYLVSPIDFVENKTGYMNEIRYYSKADEPEANKLGVKLKDITGISFQLVNINYDKSGKTIEVWYNNVTQISNDVNINPITLPIVSKSKELKILYEGNNYTSKGYITPIISGVSVYVDDFDTNSSTATFRINGLHSTPIKLNEKASIEEGKYLITIKVTNYKRYYSIRRVVMYSIIIQEKQK